MQLGEELEKLRNYLFRMVQYACNANICEYSFIFNLHTCTCVYTCINQSETCPFDRFNSSWSLTRERMPLNLKEKSFSDIKEIPREKGIGIWSFLLGVRVGHMFSVVN